MRLQRHFHLCSARPEDLKQIPVATLEIFKHLSQLPGGSLGLEPQDSVDDMIGPDFVRWIEVPGLSRRLEGPHDDPGRIRAKK